MRLRMTIYTSKRSMVQYPGFKSLQNLIDRKRLFLLCVLFLFIFYVVVRSQMTPGVEPSFDPLLSGNESPVSIFFDRSGFTFCATSIGRIYEFDGERFKLYLDLRPFEISTVNAVTVGSDNETWVAADNGIWAFERGKASFNQVLDGGATHIATRGDSIWFATSSRIGSISPEFRLDYLPKSFSEIHYFQIEGNAIWVGDSQGLFKCDEGNCNLIKSALKITDMVRKSGDSLWFASNGDGLLLYENDAFTSLNSLGGLSISQVTCLANDVRGRLLIGSKNQGLYSLYHDRLHFHDIDGLADLQEISFLGEDGWRNIWFIGDGKIVRLQPDFLDRYFELPSDDDKISSVYLVDGQIWIGTNKGAIAYLDSGERMIRQIATGFGDRIVSIAKKGAQLVVGTAHGGISVFNLSTKAWFHPTPELIDHSISNLVVTNEVIAFIDSRGQLGLIQNRLPFTDISYPFKSRHFRKLLLFQDTSILVQSDSTVHILEPKSMDLKMVLEQKTGIKTFDLLNDQSIAMRDINEPLIYSSELKIAQPIVGIPEKYGLVGKVLGASEKHYFLQTSTGIATTASSGFHHYDEFVQHSPPNFTFYSNGEVHLAYDRGLLKIPSDWFTRKRVAPIVRLTGFHSNEIFYFPHDFSQPIVLEYFDNNITFDFKGLSGNQLSKPYFQWRLIGEDADYTNPSNANVASYPRLPPGQYEFEVSAVDHSGLRSEPERLAITIKKAFWQQLWFQLACLGLLFSLFYLGLLLNNRKHRKRMRRLKEQLESERKALDWEHKAMRLQMNPHFIFNALNSISALVGKGDVKESKRMLAKFSNLMRTILELSKESLIPLRQEIDWLKNYMEVEQFLHPDLFVFNIDVAPNIYEDDTLIPPMLIQPCIENAIVHGLKGRQNGRIDVTFRKAALELICEIVDNGKGLDLTSKDKKHHQSMATDLIVKRLGPPSDRLVIETIVEDGKSMGVRATVRIPWRELPT